MCSFLSTFLEEPGRRSKQVQVTLAQREWAPLEQSTLENLHGTQQIECGLLVHFTVDASGKSISLDVTL